MAKPINNTKELKQLAIKDKLKKLELLLGYGAEFFSKYDKKLTPKEQEELLDEIEKFENHHKQ